MQGKDVKGWKWGKYMFRVVDHPIGSRLPLVSGYFDIGPVPMSGGATTVKQTSLRLGPSERMDASLGNPDQSHMEIPIGEWAMSRRRIMMSGMRITTDAASPCNSITWM